MMDQTDGAASQKRNVFFDPFHRSDEPLRSSGV